jgi:hypothetical protein
MSRSQSIELSDCSILSDTEFVLCIVETHLKICLQEVNFPEKL